MIAEEIVQQFRVLMHINQHLFSTLDHPGYGVLYGLSVTDRLTMVKPIVPNVGWVILCFYLQRFMMLVKRGASKGLVDA